MGGESMPLSPFQRIPIKYTGLYSDDHIIDLQEFGISIQGWGKLTNSIFNFYLSGNIARNAKAYQVRLFLAPPEPGCVVFDILAVLASGQLPLYAPVLCDLASDYVIPMIKAVILNRLGKKDAKDQMLDKIVEMAMNHQSFARDVHEGHMRDKAWLQGHIDTLTGKNSPALKQIAEPIGSTCKEISLGNPSPAQTLIGEAEAKVLSTKEEMIVDDPKEYVGTFEAVDTTNGNCKFVPTGSDVALSGRITDPVILLPQNPYTHSLDTKEPVKVHAKAVSQNGEVVKLFISNSLPT